MMKHLLIGASALVLTTVAAQAQVNPRGLKTQSAVQIQTVGNIPVQGTERTTFSNATKSASSKGAASTARSGVSGTFDVGSNGHAAQYNAQITNDSSGVLSVSESGNKSAIDTRGDNNEAIVDQRDGHTGWAAVRQQGNINQAKIDQEDGITGTSGTANAASIQQISSDALSGNSFTQRAEINQVHFGIGAGQNASIMQGGFNNDGAPGGTGSNNTARIDQRGSSTVSNVLNDAVVVQTETANNAYIQQGSSNSATYSSHAGIQQKANGDAGVYQTGTIDSRAYVVQFNGAKLTADVVQTGGQNNFAAVSQSVSGSRELTSFVSQSGGNNNSAFVDQSGGVAVTAYGEIFQVGSDNVALISQSASPTMDAQISQKGTGNYAATYQ